MLKVNKYFDGRVISIVVENQEGLATVGVMEAGEFEFGTSTVEIMTITGGTLDVMLPSETQWTTYHKGGIFEVGKDVRFKVKAIAPVAYHCQYK
jgi:uncharacterized protein YaiE (UPF0345 family)